MSGISCRMETDEREGCSLKKWNCKGMFIALLLAFSALLPGHASAEDLWVYQGPDGVDYYLMTETIEYTDHWYADVKFVRDGEMKFLARFRFIPTGEVVDDQDEIAADMWWRSQGKWIEMGLSPEDALASALWMDGISLIIYESPENQDDDTGDDDGNDGNNDDGDDDDETYGE